MKQLSSHMRIALAFFAAELTAVLLVPCAHADEWDKRTVLTVNETIQVQDAVLQPGQYVMRLLNSSADRHIVQIFNKRENHVIATILAIPRERLEPTGKTQFTFWETPAGTARAMRTWYYPGDLIGQEFRYPKHPYELVAAVNTTPAPTVQEQPAEPPSAAVVQPETPPAPPTPEVAETAPPAPVPEQPAEQPAPPAQPQPAAPQELPKTASPYPLVGLYGVLLLAGGGLLRLRPRTGR